VLPKLVVAVVIEAPDGCVLDRAVHPLDLTIIRYVTVRCLLVRLFSSEIGFMVSPSGTGPVAKFFRTTCELRENAAQPKFWLWVRFLGDQPPTSGCAEMGSGERNFLTNRVPKNFATGPSCVPRPRPAACGAGRCVRCSMASSTCSAQAAHHSPPASRPRRKPALVP
jgi:hypothetical protein